MKTGTERLTSATGSDGVDRFRTSIKVVIYGYDKDAPFYISDDVYSCSVSKNMKGIGQVNLSILPTKNYLNHIFPNEYVNIYFDTGNGEGWVRTFFGMVDKIEEIYDVGSDGTPNTMYQLICSDFSKAVDKLSVVFDPYLTNRQDFRATVTGGLRIGGLTNTVAGFQAQGTPPDIVVDLLILLFGNKTQFLLPKSLQPVLLNQFRDRRLELLYNRTSTDVRSALADPDAIRETIERLSTQVTDIRNQALAVEGGQRAKEIARLTGLATGTNGLTTSNFAGQFGSTGDNFTLDNLIMSVFLAKEMFPAEQHSVSFLEERSRQIFNTLVSNTGPASWLDIVDISTFVERSAMDGFLPLATAFHDEGSLMNILMSFCNEPVNEMFFDLRPYASVDGYEGADYSRDTDETGENLASTGQSGVQYIPSLVMREYPFSTIDKLAVNSGQNAVTTIFKDGNIYFGAIFSDQPNSAGRHIITMPAINPLDIKNGVSQNTARKHLDVVVLEDREIRKTSFGRSDTDHFNWFEVNMLQAYDQEIRSTVQDLVPIVTPTHILRHGIRKRSITTRFTTLTASAFGQTVAQRPPTPAQSQRLEEQAPTATIVEAEARHAVVSRPTHPINTPLYSWPVKDDSFVSSPWGYRPKLARDGEQFDGPPTPNQPNGITLPENSLMWRYHCGMDVSTYPKNETSEGKEVVAIADGEIISATFDGVLANYGNTIIIQHVDPNGGKFYSLYAHLQGFDEKNGVNTSTRAAQRGVPRGRQSTKNMRGSETTRSVSIKRGDVIGRIGHTEAPNTHGMGPHLHFEIIKPTSPNGVIFPSRNKTYLPNLPRTKDFPPGTGPAQYLPFAPLVNQPFPYTVDGVRYTFVPTPNISVDPVVFFRENGIIRNQEVIASVADGADADSAPQTENLTSTAGQATQDSSGTTTENANSPDTRPQLSMSYPEITAQVVRWSLLQDHWYQHNIEYMSGMVECRPAPEIRVGYRLDLADRDLSFYVESVSHNWTFGGHMATVVQCTRGQPNNPFPVYVVPPLKAFGAEPLLQRREDSRVNKYFTVPDPIAVRRSLVFREQNSERKALDRLVPDVSPSLNVVDTAENIGKEIVVYPVTASVSLDQVISETDLTSALDQLGNAIIDAADLIRYAEAIADPRTNEIVPAENRTEVANTAAQPPANSFDTENGGNG